MPPPPTGPTIRADSVPTGFPATEPIECCLKLIATATSHIPRDVSTLGQLFTRACSVYESVLALIQRIDNSAAADLDDDWELFDAYINAIPPLERFLFDFYQGYAPEKFRGALPPSDSTSNGVLYVQTWKADREFLSKSFEDLRKLGDLKLKGLSSQLGTSLIAQRRKDDWTLLTKLNRFIQDSRLGDAHIEKDAEVTFSVEGMKAKLADIVKRLFTLPYNEAVTSVVIRTFMYFAIPCTLIFSADVDSQWKIYLSKVVIWEAFNSLIEQVKTYLNAPRSADEIENLFFEIENLLLHLGDTDIATTAEIHLLFELAPVICKQYHSRSVALINTLHYLDCHSRKPKQKAVAPYRYDLKQVLIECVDTLTALSKIKPNIATFGTDSAEYRAMSRQIEALFDKTKALFWSLRANSLPLHEDAYSNAVSIDESRINGAMESLPEWYAQDKLVRKRDICYMLGENPDADRVSKRRKM